MLHLIAIEALILRIRGDQSAHKGEQEHEDQHGKTGNCQSVSEKALCHQCAGREHLHTAVVVQREVFLRIARIVGAGGAEHRLGKLLFYLLVRIAAILIVLIHE